MNPEPTFPELPAWEPTPRTITGDGSRSHWAKRRDVARARERSLKLLSQEPERSEEETS
jgi:hypothetical protein